MEMEVLLPSGRRWQCEAAGAPIHDLQGRVIGAVAVTVDITERKRLEEAERARVRHARLLDTIQENVPVALAYLDAKFRFTRANTPYLRAVGRPWEELLGRDYQEAVGTAATLELLARARASGERADLREAPRPSPAGGGLTSWDISATPVKDHGGAIVGYVLSAADVTERVAQRERLLAAERAAAEIAESLHDEIAHRVKNNLAMISGLLSMQALSQPDPHTAAALRAAVTRVRTFATIHEQMYTQASDQTDLLEALRRIAATTRNVFSARREIEINVRGEPFVCSGRDITNLCVMANELVTNALKHGAIGADGKLRVEIELEAQGDRVNLSVWNSGPLLPSDLEANVQGGMGLRLVSDLVSQYEGQFQLYEVDNGARAELRVPKEHLV